MTNERAQRIVDPPGDEQADETAAHSIAPPPIDRADQESQLAEMPAPEAAVADEATVLDESHAVDGDAPEIEAAVEAEAPEDLVALGDDEGDETEADDELAVATDATSVTEGVVATEDSAIEDAAADGSADEADEADDAEDESVPSEALPQLLEALLFVADEPIAPSALGRALEVTPRQVRRGLDDLADTLREDNRGVRLQQGPDGAQLVTAPEAANSVELFLGLEANRRLSNAALETLAIVAYRQPVTRHVIEQIRGVSSDGAVATLRARGLIEGIGRAPGPGRPLLFSTTQRFLEHFGLERPDELPPLPDDVELPPEDGGAQLTFESGSADGSDHVDEAVVDEITEQTAAEAPELVGDTEVIENALDDDEEFEPFEEVDEIEDDPELEISADLDDLSRAAGVALSAPSEAAADGASGDD